MEQLSGLDATFLYMESSTNYGHVGGLQIFANAATPHWRTPEEEAAHTEYLYSLATYTRRRLVEVPFGLDHPYWIEDPAFDREFHERFIAVPAPGTDRQLEQVVSRIAARPLDRSRPLWEVYLIEGVDEGRKFALYSKTHHCAIDGASGTQLALATMQLTPEPVNHPMPATPWRPERVPSQAEMLARGLAATAQRPAKLLGVQRRAIRQTVNGLRRGSGGPPRAGTGPGAAQPAAHAGAAHRVQPAHRPAPPLRLRVHVAGRGPHHQDGLRLHRERCRPGDVRRHAANLAPGAGPPAGPAARGHGPGLGAHRGARLVARQPGVGHGRRAAHRRTRPGGADRARSPRRCATRRSCRPPCPSTPSWRC